MKTKEILYRGANATIVTILFLEIWGNHNASYVEIAPSLTFHFIEAFLPDANSPEFHQGMSFFGLMQSTASLLSNANPKTALSGLSLFANISRVCTNTLAYCYHSNEDTSSKKSSFSDLRR